MAVAGSWLFEAEAELPCFVIEEGVMDFGMGLFSYVVGRYVMW